MIRPPVVAGSFYPADKQELTNQIKRFLKRTESSKLIPGSLKILIVPHAGYDYSGQTAAFGYHQIKNKDYPQAILIGPTHQAHFSGAVSSSFDFWQTPLGSVKVNQRLQSNLKFELNNQAHQFEHSLEVQLPFLQTVLKKFSIFPLLLGEGNQKDWQVLAMKLSSVIGKKTLVVISSDLSHYPPADIAEKVDHLIIKAILSGQVNQFTRVIQEEMSKGYPQLHTCACGENGIVVALFLAQALGIKKTRLLNYTHSGKVTGDNSRVVGYASIGFYK